MNDDADRFKKDKRVCPNYERDNLFLNSCEERAGKILLMFAEKGQNWSLIQFEEEFCCKNRGNRINDIFIEHIDLLKATGHIGNAKKFEGTLRMLEKYDKKIKERTCAEIDFKYVTGFNAALEKRGCCGNTRRIYLKPLSVILNKAIKEKKCSLDTYPFGKGGFELGKLSEVTEKKIFASARTGTYKRITPGGFCFGACPQTLSVFLLLFWNEYGGHGEIDFR